MNARLRQNLRTPFLVLLYSFLIGLLIDAVAEHLGAQESSRKTARYARLIKQDEPRPSIITDLEAFDLQDDSQDSPIIPGTLLDGSALFKPIQDIPLSVFNREEPSPEDLAEGKRELADAMTNYPGTFQDRVAMWCAPNIRYQPLYFEDVGLERYGYQHGDLWQPACSALHFGASFTMLPFNLMRDKPGRCTYPLGYCRPGSCAPQIKDKWFFWK